MIRGFHFFNNSYKTYSHPILRRRFYHTFVHTPIVVNHFLDIVKIIIFLSPHFRFSGKAKKKPS